MSPTSLSKNTQNRILPSREVGTHMSEIKNIAIPTLEEHILDPDPIKQFRIWFDDAVKAKLPHADAMTLATATTDGSPSARIVLLKLVDERGFVFYSNYDSRKGQELASNPKAALTFFWPELDRQVRAEGVVSKVSAKDSDAYFATRPRDGQLSSLTSQQSSPIESREQLDRRFDELKRQFDGKPVTRPANWGGYRLNPVSIEFWQSRFARLNDRILFERQSNGTWKKIRLQP